MRTRSVGRCATMVALALLWAPIRGDETTHGEEPNRAVIYVARRGWHIDVGFAASDIRSPLDALAAQFPGLQYLFFGFGDQHYLESKNRNGPVLLAALWPGRALLLATGLSASPQQAFEESQVIMLHVTEQESRDAQEFVWQSLAQPVSHSPGPYEGSLYFPARAKYSAAHTCNTWAAETLAAASLPIHSSGVVFAGQLWSQVRHLQDKQAAVAQSTALAQPVLPQQGGLVPFWQITVVPEF
jgi:Protein of unknown function (DUF2459)